MLWRIPLPNHKAVQLPAKLRKNNFPASWTSKFYFCSSTLNIFSCPKNTWRASFTTGCHPTLWCLKALTTPVQHQVNIKHEAKTHTFFLATERMIYQPQGNKMAFCSRSTVGWWSAGNELWQKMLSHNTLLSPVCPLHSSRLSPGLCSEKWRLT